MRTIGVLPASGKASRIGGIPKFCLPISDERSLLQWHVEQMLEVCDEVYQLGLSGFLLYKIWK
jgi:molybdopterin-guanine dinucleotide biosynthesis protein A